uniref:Uncharacterized protein n=1 Tax=viral metagenome TaxID=1070528 RepID=A0A6C0DGD1_9ZZZZ
MNNENSDLKASSTFLYQRTGGGAHPVKVSEHSGLRKNDKMPYQLLVIETTDNYRPATWNTTFVMIKDLTLEKFIEKYIEGKEEFKDGYFSKPATSGGRRRRRSTKKARKTRRRSKK